MNKLHIIAATAVITLATACTHSKPLTATTPETVTEYSERVWHNNSPHPRNIIFVVGDGMGTTQVYASIVAHHDGSQFLRFPFTGFSRTYSNNKYTTDSGAGGTALMTGHKVNNRAISQAPDGTDLPSFFTTLKEHKGKATGFVVTCSVVDATPATTYGHTPDRSMKDTLSMQMAQCSHDVMIGADKKQFLPEGRKDAARPIDTLLQRGYTMIYNLQDLKKCNNDKICALLSADDEPGDANQRNYWLVDGTKKAIEILNKHPQGFALMVEGSQIDWGGHNNDTALLFSELDEFEKTLKVVLDFAEKDGNTLVVVTADHETGGLVLTDGDIKAGRNECKFVTTNHSGVMVPVFAYGPGAERFTGIQQNTDIYKKIINLMGMK